MQDGRARRRLVGSSSGAELEDRAVLAEMFRKNFRNSYEIMENRVTLVAPTRPLVFFGAEPVPGATAPMADEGVAQRSERFGDPLRETSQRRDQNQDSNVKGE
jgi:hypothetical protein